MTTLDINAYTQKQQQLQHELDDINRQIILAEQELKQTQDYFQEHFGTTDLAELEKLKNTYLATIQEKEKELADLENNL